MRTIALAVAVTLLASLASAQTNSVEIRGTLSTARGPLAGVDVRVKNVDTGEVTVATTSPAGEYFVAVVPGTYDVFASPVGYIAYARRQITLQAGTTMRVYGVLADYQNAGTPGEIPFLYRAADARPPSGPTPRSADGMPDLSGVWFPGPDIEPEVTPFQPWAAAVVRERASRPGDDPRAQCLPTGVARMHTTDLVKFVQTPNLLVVLMEGGVPGSRQIFLDGRKHPDNLQPTWLGHSVGTWEQDTLVIDSRGFNDKGWLDGAKPQTEQLHVIERYRRLDFGHLQLEITIDDPGAYTKPWKVRRLLRLAVGDDIQEFICNENNKTEHFVAH
jgi:Carboxypeptidase regulatory-like domain